MKTENEFRALIENLSVGILKQGPDAAILFSNQAALNLLGLTKDQLLGKTSFDPDWHVIHEDGSAFPGNTHPVPAVIASLQPVRDVVMGVYRPVSKDRVWLLVNALPYFNEAGKLDYVICTFNDITYQKNISLQLQENENIIRKSKRLYKLTARVNDLILHEKDAAVIFNNTCKIAVDTGGFLFAWIGVPDENTLRIRPEILWGNDASYLECFPNASIRDIPEGRGPTGRAFREGKHYYCNDIANDPTMAPWRVEALKRGFRSSIALPFLQNGQVVAVLTLYAAEPDIFKEEEEKLLIRAAENISFALNTIALEKERKITESKLHKITQAVEQTTLAVIIMDTHGIVEYVNPAFTTLSGYSFEEVAGENIRQFNTMSGNELSYEQIELQLRKNLPWHGELTNHKKNGDLFWESLVISPVFDQNGNRTNLIAIKEDITGRKLTEAALQEKTKFVTNILESSMDIISVLDKNGKRVYLSQSAERILGFSMQKLLQTSLFEYIPEDERELVVSAFQQKAGIQNLTHRMLCKDGRLKYFSLSSRWDPESECRYSISKDITYQLEETREKERLKIEAEQKIKKAVFEGEENEKLFLSLELHDNISQILSATRMFLGMYIKKGNTQHLEESMQLLEQSIKETRNLSHSIALPKLKEIGLKDSVQLLLNHYNEASNIRFTLIAHYLEIDIPYDLAINIYRIIQEQVNNIVKHSNAKKATISITEMNRKLTIEITDDGVGFNPEETDIGIGLMNMKTRVNLFYGKMDIQSLPLQGCKLFIEFYLDQDFQ
jgi:PAS domain S-box-containing protein